MSRSFNLIVIHCSATANGDPLFRGVAGQPGFATAADVIDGWHGQRGFRRSGPDAQRWNPKLRHIGYHFVLPSNGAVFTGRSLVEPGAHVAGHNAHSIGICLTGTSKYTVDQWRALEALLRQLSTAHGIPLQPARVGARTSGRPTLVHGVCGHRDLSPDRNGDGVVDRTEWTKMCPGFDVRTYLESGLIPPRDAVILPEGGHA
jgi:hypothetical protein